ncbi:cyanobactin biosynthesis system PatB/AcyB/McaB family protein [Actinoallomurus purpureus]|uniref:cyanobactin biosynthesis system PatB/AcyB/McaB family protein n=1 Tax=Actinoallomurus purpureus TaxID=478114 RepID=UPI002092252E|nr:cyanobactin biosynthesis system PatB/AcyB/McaB family protein [Actinoallomurus purpureus]MCO6008515.1 cyanobactin biosynthesis system PatB/AcyB/McaB family protein [Actinoallomurus purpureus]
MNLPPQAPPVHRPALVDPASTVDLDPPTPEHLARVRAYLTYSANFNDPQAYTLPTYQQAMLSATS